MFVANGMRAQEWDAVPLRAFPQGHVYMGGFYNSGVIAPQREDPVFEQLPGSSSSVTARRRPRPCSPSTASTTSSGPTSR